jgi:hypothetical protein
METLQEKIDYLTQKLFGTSSEKTKKLECRLSLFDEAEQEACPQEEPAVDAVVVREHTRNAKRTSEELFKGVPTEDVVIPLSEDQKNCPDCGTPLEVIGKEYVRQEFQFTPAVAWVMYQKYANAVPLYRQEKDWNQMGVPFNRATLANWVIYCAKNYFTPLYNYFHRELLKRLPDTPMTDRNLSQLAPWSKEVFDHCSM